jgi:hypothetical protein
VFFDLLQLELFALRKKIVLKNNLFYFVLNLLIICLIFGFVSYLLIVMVLVVYKSSWFVVGFFCGVVWDGLVFFGVGLGEGGLYGSNHEIVNSIFY